MVCWVVSSLRVAPPWRPAANQRLIFMGILRWLFCHRTWCQGAIASLARHFAVGLVFWLEVSVTADCDCGSNSLDFKQLTVLFLSGAGLFADKHLPC